MLNLCSSEVNSAVRDNYNPKSNKYVRITTYQPDTKSNPNPINSPYTAHNSARSTKYSHISYVSMRIHTRHVVAPSVRL